MNDLRVRGEEVNGVRAIFSAGVIAAYYNVSFRRICDYVLWSVCEWLALFQNVFLVLVDEYFRNAIKNFVSKGRLTVCMKQVYIVIRVLNIESVSN